MKDIIIEIVQQTLMVSGFVLFMMLIIEYVNVRSKGNWSAPLKKSKFVQILFASLLGIIPGCVGTFTVVSLYTHGIINFSALMIAAITTIGDESFVMFSLMPGTAVKIIAILLFTGIVTGIITNLFLRNRKISTPAGQHLKTHDDHCCDDFGSTSIFGNIKKMSFQRALIVAVLLLVTLSQVLGHEENAGFGELIWETVFFAAGAVGALLIVLRVPDHFLHEHLWGHVIKKHFLRIFLWTLGILALIALLLNYFNFREWVETNHFSILLIALVVGIIPISGPHILFITLFFNGAIPFSILLANSIVQDGHGALPLLAEDKKSFVVMKAIKLVIGLGVGLAGYYWGF